MIQVCDNGFTENGKVVFTKLEKYMIPWQGKFANELITRPEIVLW